MPSVCKSLFVWERVWHGFTFNWFISPKHRVHFSTTSCHCPALHPFFEIWLYQVDEFTWKIWFWPLTKYTKVYITNIYITNIYYSNIYIYNSNIYIYLSDSAVSSAIFHQISAHVALKLLRCNLLTDFGGWFPTWVVPKASDIQIPAPPFSTSLFWPPSFFRMSISSVSHAGHQSPAIPMLLVFVPTVWETHPMYYERIIIHRWLSEESCY